MDPTKKCEVGVLFLWLWILFFVSSLEFIHTILSDIINY